MHPHGGLVDDADSAVKIIIVIARISIGEGVLIKR